jgi:hypothetical protein
MIMRLALLVLAMFALLLTDTPQAAACSGFYYVPPPFRELIRGAGTIVLGSTVELDDAGRNGIFEVQSYLKGGGAERILLALKSPNEILAGEELRSVGNCGFGPPATPAIGQPSILLLDVNQDGSYRAHSYTYGFHTQTEHEQIFPIPFYSFQDTVVMRDFTFDELQHYIQQVVGRFPTLPQATLPPPVTAPLIITTDRGENYLLPVNGGNPVLLYPDELQHYIRPAGCSAPPCYAYSPNGLDQVLLMATPPPEDLPNPITLIRLQADAVLFSPTSDAIAVWKGNLLELYALHYPRLGFGPATTNFVFGFELVNQMTINQYTSYGRIQAGRAAWTPDGRMLAFTDGEGLWLWDAFMLGSIPRLLSPSPGLIFPKDVLYARYFSPLGRYLAVETEEERYTLDIISRQRLPDGIISSDDRTLLAFDTTAETFMPVIYQLAPPREIGVIQIHALIAMRQVEWLDNDSFMFLGDYEGWVSYANDDERFMSWRGVSTTITAWPSGGSTGSIYGDAFDYDPITDSLATIIDETRITLNGTEYDFEPYIDSPIVDIQWLPPLFYYED